MFSGSIDRDTPILQRMSNKRTDILATFQQRFASGQSEHQMLLDDAHWKESIPHEFCGPCYTYDPPYDSDPGYQISMYMTMKLGDDWDSNLQIFLHNKNKFFYSTTPTYNTFILGINLLNESGVDHPRVIGKKPISQILIFGIDMSVKNYIILFYFKILF